jgi:hypothetical protein
MRLSTSLNKTIVDRHLLSSFPAINVKMIQIPFKIYYLIKEEKKQQTATPPLLIILQVTQLHSATVLTYSEQNADNCS